MRIKIAVGACRNVWPIVLQRLRRGCRAEKDPRKSAVPLSSPASQTSPSGSTQQSNVLFMRQEASPYSYGLEAPLKKALLFLILICTLAGASDAQSYVNCFDYGSGVHCDNGVSALRSGNRLYFNDGTSVERIGNQTYFSTGVMGNTVGNTTYFTDGSTAVRTGNTITVTSTPQSTVWVSDPAAIQEQRAEQEQANYEAGYAMGYALGTGIGLAIDRIQAKHLLQHHCELDPYWSAACGTQFSPGDQQKLQARMWEATWDEIPLFLRDKSVTDSQRATIINYLYAHPGVYRGKMNEKAAMYGKLYQRLIVEQKKKL